MAGLIQDQKREAILSRRTLTDPQWALIEPLVPGKEGDRGRSGEDNRLFVDAILWLARAASPWRDLPPVAVVGGVGLLLLSEFLASRKPRLQG